MKANDKDVPEDEMMLAAAIAAAEDRGLEWCSYAPFRDDLERACEPHEAESCCALGALTIAGVITRRQSRLIALRPNSLKDVDLGNDAEFAWGLDFNDDRGESLGWAFRCAMTQEDG